MGTLDARNLTDLFTKVVLIEDRPQVSSNSDSGLMECDKVYTQFGLMSI